MSLRGANKFGREFADFTGEILKMQQALKDGKVTQEEMDENIAESIPVVGKWVQGFMDVRELLTGEKEQIKEIQEESEMTAKSIDAWVSSIDRARDSMRSLALDIAASGRTAAAAFGTPFEKELARIENDYAAQFGDGGEFFKKREDALKGRNEAIAKQDELEKPFKDRLKVAQDDLDSQREGLRGAKADFGANDEGIKRLLEPATKRVADIQSQLLQPENAKKSIEQSFRDQNAQIDRAEKARQNAFGQTSAAALIESTPSFELGTTGLRQSGGIAFQGSVSPGLDQMLLHAEATAQNTDRAARAGESLLDFLQKQKTIDLR